MEVTTSIEGSKAFIGLAGKMTVHASPKLGAAIAALPREVCDIDIDLAGVGYVSSAGLRSLVAASKLATGRGGAFRLLHPHAEVLERFDLAGLADVLAIER